MFSFGRWVPVVLLGLLPLTSFACAEIAGPGHRTDVDGAQEHPRAQRVDEEPVTAEFIGSTIVLRNRGALDRYILAVEEEFATLIDVNVAPDSRDHLPRLLASGEIQLPLADVAGWSSGARRVVIYSWTGSRAVPVSGGLQWVAEGWHATVVER